MRGTGIGTSLILIAVGAVLAFGVTLQTNSIDISAIGAILIVVGIIGLLVSFLLLQGLTTGTRAYDDNRVVHEDAGTRPHEHRRVSDRDVVVEDEDTGTTRVERVREVRR